MGAPYQLVPGSIYDGNTLRVTDGVEEIKTRLCGVDAPELDMPMGVESRDHLRKIVAQGDGTIVVVPIETDRYGWLVAELFVPIREDWELPVNAQMVADG
ncbi:MAG: thermonuclease family protein, partial [Cyanobacteria bacterium P01_F01_bin.53]